MKKTLRKVPHRYSEFRLSRGTRSSVVFAIVLFFGSILANYCAGLYAASHASNSVTDIVLSNTPVFNVDGLLVYGAVALLLFVITLILTHPKRIPFTMQSLTIFLFTRAGFISLTHLRTFPIHAQSTFTDPISVFLYNAFLYGDDLFFSGHTGVPFLMALLFWRDTTIRYIFLGWTVVFGTAVLLGHVHYTIDVASAFFITYGVYEISKYFFPKDYKLFNSVKVEE